MRKILFISGTALGHVSRLLVIANSLRKMAEVEIHFAVSSLCNFRELVEREGFKLLTVNTPKGIPPFATFANGLDTVFAETEYQAIVVDLNPVGWTCGVTWPQIPRIFVTNAFIVQPFSGPTAQEQGLLKHGASINQFRRSRGLPDLVSHRELYEAEEVLFCDPSDVVKALGPLKSNQRSCGACFWEMEGNLPDELAGVADILLASMGSSGRSELGEEMFRSVADFSRARAIVYVGPNQIANHGLQVECHAYKTLPFGSLLHTTRMAITQGGSGSTYQALSYGVPLVVAPWHRNHEILGEIIELLGAGVKISSQEDIGKLDDLEFESLASKAESISRKMKSEDGPGTVAAALMRWL